MTVDSDFSRKKLLIFGVILLLFLAIPLTVYVAMRQQDTRSKAAPDVADSVVVAVINGQQITKAQVREVAEEQNDPSVVTSESLQLALEILEERMILDKTAASLGIQIDPKRVNEYKLQDFSETDALYEALREQIILNVVKSREALSVGFWNPPTSGVSTLSVEEQSLAATELTKGIPVLADAQAGLEDGDTVLQVGDSILADAPELKPVLAVNGNIYSLQTTGSEKELAAYPQIYEFGDSGLDTETRDGLFAMQLNEVKTFSDTEGNRGGSVFKVIARGNDSGIPTYEEWLTQQKATLVQDLNVL